MFEEEHGEKEVVKKKSKMLLYKHASTANYKKFEKELVSNQLIFFLLFTKS